ncbi:hypothetical protein DVH24_020647 [Malus domestica]|uniref:Cytochrome P450 n=1 Tax=Malus domestica TaxID=3750 RepID=A0A498JBY8_MALDO|nr:hypothetical protein DVH24_020647 [Malus domestica]
MKSTFFELTLNVLIRIIAGKRYYGEHMADLEEANWFKRIVTETFELSGATNIGDFVPALKYLGVRGLEKKLVILQKKGDGFMQDLIEEHRKLQSSSVSEQKRKTKVEVLLSLQETEPEYYTDEIIRGIMQTEIDNHIGQSCRLLEESDLPKLPYLQGIISETLRMYPTGPLLAPHESVKDCTVGGFHVPRGTMLFMNIWAIQHNPKLWAQPDQFKPERFHNLQEERDGFVWLPFGAGRRGCPGEGLATRIVGLTLGSLIQCFEWERIGEEMVDMREGTGLTMPRAQPLLAKCRPRPKMLALLSQL